MGGGLGQVKRHPEYYFDDGSVSFLTDSVLFRVHKTFFHRESDVFQDLFESTAKDDPLPGTDACPFTLDVTPGDFAQFLWVWYDREYGYRDQNKANWLTILRLATRWHFYKIKELALREIEFLALPPAERISIYDDYGIDGERLISSCIELCKSPSVPTQDEARFIKMDTLIKILQAREDAQHKAAEMGHETPTSACLEDGDLREIVLKLFEKGLNPRSNGTSTGSGDQAVLRTRDTTIIVGAPQVPDRKQTASQPQTDGDGKARQEKKQGERAESNDAYKEGSREGEKRLAEDKEKAEKEKAEKAKQTKGREGAEKDKGKEAEGKKPKTEQKPPGGNPRGKWGNN